MAKKTVDWMKKPLEMMIQQFDQFTLKLPSYQATFGLTAAQTTASRNDYLWAAYSVQTVMQFDLELKNRVSWRDSLLNGPATTAAAPVPSIGTEFGTPAVPDGILTRWRKLVEQLKSHSAYTQAIGDDLGVEATESPAQRMKPFIRAAADPGGVVNMNIVKDGHDSLAVYSKRNGEAQPALLGIFTRSRVTDNRPNLVAGQPEPREYTAQYRDSDVPVGDISDPCRISTKV